MMRTLNFTRRTLPNLVVARRVLNKMAVAARHYVQDETGEAMVGLVVPGERTNGIETLYVLDTVSPDDSAVRQFHTFQQGDERQEEIVWWLQENWHQKRERNRENPDEKAWQAKWDVPLRYLGDWHKQPGFMIAPSSGDQRTALDWLDDPDNEMEFLLAPIVTLGHPTTTMSIDASSNFVVLPQTEGLQMRVDFWYIDRDVRMFQPIVPAIYPDEQLPELYGYPWHLVDQSRASHEFALMHEDDLFVSIVLWNATDELPLDVCFMVARMGSDRVLLIATSWDYPDKPPVARVAPFVQMGGDDKLYDIFEQLWVKSEPVPDPEDWKWSIDKHLVDYVRALEAALGMKTSTKPLTGPPVTTDEDDDDEMAHAGDIHAAPADLDAIAEDES